MKSVNLQVLAPRKAAFCSADHCVSNLFPNRKCDFHGKFSFLGGRIKIFRKKTPQKPKTSKVLFYFGSTQTNAFQVTKKDDKVWL